MERQCAEPVQPPDQHSATTSAASVCAGLAGDEQAEQSPVEERTVSPGEEVARSEDPEGAAGPNAMMAAGRSASPAAEQQCAVLVVADRCALSGDRRAFPEADRSE